MFGISEKKIERWQQERNLPKLQKAVAEAESYAQRLQALAAINALENPDALPTVLAAFNDPVRAVAKAATEVAESLTRDSNVLQHIESLRKEWETIDQNTVKRQQEAAERNEEDERVKLAKRAREIELHKAAMKAAEGTQSERMATGFLQGLLKALYNLLRF